MWGIVLSMKVVFTNQFHQYLREDERVNPAELPDQPRSNAELNSLELPDQPPRGTNRLQLVWGSSRPRRVSF